jgi:hypothetical protein
MTTFFCCPNAEHSCWMFFGFGWLRWFKWFSKNTAMTLKTVMLAAVECRKDRSLFCISREVWWVCLNYDTAIFEGYIITIFQITMFNGHILEPNPPLSDAHNRWIGWWVDAHCWWCPLARYPYHTSRIVHGYIGYKTICNLIIYSHMGMDQYLLIPFLGGWTSIYQLFWCSPGVQGFDTQPYTKVS